MRRFQLLALLFSAGLLTADPTSIEPLLDSQEVDPSQEEEAVEITMRDDSSFNLTDELTELTIAAWVLAQDESIEPFQDYQLQRIPAQEPSIPFLQILQVNAKKNSVLNDEILPEIKQEKAHLKKPTLDSCYYSFPFWKPDFAEKSLISANDKEIPLEKVKQADKKFNPVDSCSLLPKVTKPKIESISSFHAPTDSVEQKIKSIHTPYAVQKKRHVPFPSFEPELMQTDEFNLQNESTIQEVSSVPHCESIENKRFFSQAPDPEINRFHHFSSQWSELKPLQLVSNSFKCKQPSITPTLLFSYELPPQTPLNFNVDTDRSLPQLAFKHEKPKEILSPKVLAPTVYSLAATAIEQESVATNCPIVTKPLEKKPLRHAHSFSMLFPRVLTHSFTLQDERRLRANSKPFRSPPKHIVSVVASPLISPDSPISQSFFSFNSLPIFLKSSPNNSFKEMQFSQKTAIALPKLAVNATPTNTLQLPKIDPARSMIQSTKKEPKQSFEVLIDHSPFLVSLPMNSDEEQTKKLQYVESQFPVEQLLSFQKVAPPPAFGVETKAEKDPQFVSQNFPQSQNVLEENLCKEKNEIFLEEIPAYSMTDTSNEQAIYLGGFPTRAAQKILTDVAFNESSLEVPFVIPQTPYKALEPIKPVRAIEQRNVAILLSSLQSNAAKMLTGWKMEAIADATPVYPIRNYQDTPLASLCAMLGIERNQNIRLNQRHRMSFYQLSKFPTYDELDIDSYVNELEPSVTIIPRKDSAGFLFHIVLTPRSRYELKKQPRELVFLIDRSSHEQKNRFNAYRNAVKKSFEYLDEEDSFNVVFLDRNMTSLFEKPKRVTRTNLRHARRFLHNNDFSPFMNSNKSLYEIMASSDEYFTEENPNRFLVFLSSGFGLSELPKKKATINEIIRRNSGKLTLLTACCSDRCNAAMLDLLATLNRGEFTYSPTLSSFPRRFAKLLKNTSGLITKDVHLSAIGEDLNLDLQIYPRGSATPHFYYGKPLELIGTTDRLDDFYLLIQGKMGDRYFQSRKKIEFSKALKGSTSLYKKFAIQKAYENYQLYLSEQDPYYLRQAAKSLKKYNMAVPFKSSK